MDASALVPGTRILVEGVEVHAEGELVSADDTMIMLRDPRDGDAEYEISWADIRTISVRAGKENRSNTATFLALLCAALLGTCGWILDGIDRSTSGYGNRSFLMFPGILVGALVGWVLGRLLTRAGGSAYWQPIYRVADGVEPPAKQPLEGRLAAGAVPEEERMARAGRESLQTGLAWIILLALFFGVAALCRG